MNFTSFAAYTAGRLTVAASYDFNDQRLFPKNMHHPYMNDLKRLSLFSRVLIRNSLLLIHIRGDLPNEYAGTSKTCSYKISNMLACLQNSDIRLDAG